MRAMDGTTEFRSYLNVNGVLELATKIGTHLCWARKHILNVPRTYTLVNPILFINLLLMEKQDMKS